VPLAKKEKQREQKAENVEIMRQTEDRRREKLLHQLPKLDDKEPLDVTIDSLEDHFRYLRTPTTKWNFLLYSMLTNRATELAADIHHGPDVPYQDIRRRLLEAAGFTIEPAGRQLWNTNHTEFQNLTPAQWFNRQRRLVRRIIQGSTTLPGAGRAYLDSRQTHKDVSFLDALQRFYAME